MPSTGAVPWMKGWIDGQKDEWMKEWIDRLKMDGWMDETGMGPMKGFSFSLRSEELPHVCAAG